MSGYNFAILFNVTAGSFNVAVYNSSGYTLTAVCVILSFSMAIYMIVKQGE